MFWGFVRKLSHDTDIHPSLKVFRSFFPGKHYYQRKSILSCIYHCLTLIITTNQIECVKKNLSISSHNSTYTNWVEESEKIHFQLSFIFHTCHARCDKKKTSKNIFKEHLVRWKFSHLVSQALEIGYIFEFSPLIARRYFAPLCMKGKFSARKYFHNSWSKKKEGKEVGEKFLKLIISACICMNIFLKRKFLIAGKLGIKLDYAHWFKTFSRKNFIIKFKAGSFHTEKFIEAEGNFL